MKKMLKYQLKDLLIGYSVYAGLMLLLTISLGIIACIYKDANITMSGIGLSSSIFCMVVGIGMYKENCQMALLNSVSRKDFFKSSMCTIVIVSFLCSLLDLVILFIGLVTKLISNGMASLSPYGLIQELYPETVIHNSTALTAISSLLALLINILLFVLGMLIAGIYCRIPKKFRTFYCIALPVFGFGVSPVLLAAAMFWPGVLDKAATIFLAVMGISSNNPFLGMFTLTVISLIIAGICYRLLKKTEIA